MKIYNILSAIIITSFFTSCENEIPFDIKENSPKLIVNAMININFEDNYIFVSKTGKDSTTSVTDATVNIYINDALRDKITEEFVPEESDSIHYFYYSNPSDKKYKTSLRFNPGDKVKIEVFADNNKYHAWAEDIIPRPLEIDKIDTLTFTKDYHTNIRLKTTFTDYPNERNFYRLVVVQKNGLHLKIKEEEADIPGKFEEYEETKYMDTRQDPILNNGRVSTDDDIFPQTENRYAVFDDKQLNSTHTMTTSFIRPNEYDSYYMWANSIIDRVSVEFKVHLLSITEIQYYYLKALNIVNDDSYDEYLSMPVVYPSNVEGGVGIVGFSSGTNKTFTIPDIIPDPLGGGYGGPHYPY